MSRMTSHNIVFCLVIFVAITKNFVAITTKLVMAYIFSFQFRYYINYYIESIPTWGIVQSA